MASIACHYRCKRVTQSNYVLESQSLKIAAPDASLIFRISRKLNSSKWVKLISASMPGYPLIVVEGIDILERCGGQLGWKVVVHSNRKRTSLLEHRIRLRTFVLVLVVISYLRNEILVRLSRCANCFVIAAIFFRSRKITFKFSQRIYYRE